MMKKFLLYSLLAILGLAVFAVLFFSVRQTFARAEVARDWQSSPESAPGLETTSRLEILPLYEEDRSEERFDMGHGVSYLIRTDSSTVLLDLGNNPTDSPQLPSLKNMQELGISLDEVDAIVISHPHPDHVGGVMAWQNKTIFFGDFTGDLSQMRVYIPDALTYSAAELIPSLEPTLISKDIATTGAISYPEVFPIYLFNSKGHEQGIVIHVAGEGLVVITGCGHPGMEKLIERAETLYAEQVVGVIGGLHYEKLSTDQVQPHIQFLASRQPRLVALSPHDSSPEALAAFQTSFTDAYHAIHVGETIQFP